MKGKKLLSIILSLLMVISLMPMDSAKVHASSHKLKCINCNEWVEEGDYCDNCASEHLCVCESCHDFFHCALCDGCYLNFDVEPCDENCFNVICIDCAEQEGYHCPECHECYQGDEDKLCGNCFRCPECCEICDNCGWCFECQPHCPECGNCDYEDEKCENDGEHCKDCCMICPECEECMLEKEQEPCEYCELCPECCEYNSCEYCGMCVEHPDYENHLCSECGTCFEVTDKCETCGLCVDCCLNEAASAGCECGEYCHEEVDDDHICDNCGECFGIVERSEEAEENGLCLCIDCYEEYLDIMDEGVHEITPTNTYSMDSEYHWKECKYCDDEEHVTNKSEHNYNEYGVCKVCGYKDGSNIYVTKQPKSRTIEISSKDTKDEDKDKAYFNIVASSKNELKYEWQYRVIGSANIWKAFAEGEAEGINTPSLVYTARPGDCHNLDGSKHNRLYIRCKISGNGLTDYTDVVYVTVEHNYEPNENKSFDETGHSFKCADESCAYYGKEEKHKYTNWQWNESKTEKTATCEICGYKKTFHIHKHGIDNFYDHMQGATLTNKDTNEYTGEDYGYEFKVDERHHEGYCDVEGISECGVFISEAHDWKPWETITNTPKKEGERGGIHRTCKVCEYDEDRVQFDENGKELYWEFGVHPVTIINGSTDCGQGLIREGQTINLIPDKVEDKVFDGWKVNYEKLNKFANPDNNNYINKTEIVRVGMTSGLDEIGFTKGLRTLTIPEWNDAGVWTLTALYKDGCKHDKTEVTGKLEATCGHMGYTGDTVCSDCGKVMVKGQDIDRLEHKHVHIVEETEVLKDYKGDDAYNNKGELIYKCRTHELGDCVKHEKSYSGDYICDDCGQIVEKGHFGAPEHDWEVLDTVKDATMRSKGKDHCKCKKCGVIRDVIRDYTGLDYTVIPSRRNITFNYEYGKNYEPVVIDFKRTGRNSDEIEKIIGVDFYCSGETVDVKVTGDMQLSIRPKAINYGAFDLDETIDVEFITKSGEKVWLSSFAYSEPGLNGDYDENYDYSIKINTNIRKSKETYTLTVINGEIYDYSKISVIGNTKELHAGEDVNIVAPSGELKEKFGKDCFVEWEVVSDDSGIYKEYFSKYGSKDGVDMITMPNNDVVLRAVLKHKHDYEFVKTVTPTATEKGYDLYKCKYCSEELKKNEKAPLGNVNGDSKTANKNNKTNQKKVSLKQVKLHKLKAKKKGIKVSWKKVSGADGYQIQYSLNNKFKKGKKFGTKKVLVKNSKTIKKVLKKLKSKKIYFVRIRAYKIVNGKKKFGPWSKNKKAKVK